MVRMRILHKQWTLLRGRGGGVLVTATQVALDTVGLLRDISLAIVLLLAGGGLLYILYYYAAVQSSSATTTFLQVTRSSQTLFPIAIQSEVWI